MGDMITSKDKWCLLPEEKGSWEKKETQSRKKGRKGKSVELSV